MNTATQVVDQVGRELGGRATDVPVRVVERARTKLFFFTIDGRDGKQDLVAKLKRSTPAARCRREYEAMVEIERRFARCGDERLHAVGAVSYLPMLNAIVMKRIDGPALFDETMPLVRLATQAGRRRAAELLRTTGRWLRVLHGVEPSELQPRVSVRCARAVEGVAEEVSRLIDLGVRVDRVSVQRALEILSPCSEGPDVWLHSDFHLRNVHVVGAHGIVGVDTALSWKGNPYADLGKFVADMKTRRERILRRGWLPSMSLLSKLESALLDGYHDGSPPADLRQLRLFEGWFLLRKWRRVVEDVSVGRGATRDLIGAIARRAAIDPTYAAVVRRWAMDVSSKR